MRCCSPQQRRICGASSSCSAEPDRPSRMLARRNRRVQASMLSVTQRQSGIGKNTQPSPRCETQSSFATTAVVRKVTRDLDENVRDHVRALANTEGFQQSRRERKKVEMRFAHMKRILRLDRLRLRGLSGVKDEVLLTATAQNLRRLVKLLCRAPPPVAAACPA